ERPLDDLLPVRSVTKSLDRLVEVRQVLLDSDVVGLRLEDAVVVACEEELARLRPDRLEVPRRERFSGDVVDGRTCEETRVQRLEARLRVLLLERLGGRQQRALPIEVIGARLRADRALAA